MRKIFLSYHHDDLLEATAFCKRYAGYFDEIRNLGIDERGEEYAERINSGDSDYVMQKIREDYMAGTTCTVVLIGKCTWARRYIDWEIAATLRNNVNDPKSGLIAVQLGSAERNGFTSYRQDSTSISRKRRDRTMAIAVFIRRHQATGHSPTGSRKQLQGATPWSPLPVRRQTFAQITPLANRFLNPLRDVQGVCFSNYFSS